MNKEVNKW